MPTRRSISAPTASRAAGPNPNDLAVGDLDGDGRDELLVATSGDDARVVLRARPAR